MPSIPIVLPIVQAAICVKAGDVYVSRSIIEKGAWEEENVAIAMRAMEFYNDAVFIGQTSLVSSQYYHNSVSQMQDPILACTP